jgi:hypothetical protein
MKKITFVIGAGASDVYGFPLGSKLVPLIRDFIISKRPKSNNDTSFKPLNDLADLLYTNTIPSIDSFITIHQNNPYIHTCLHGIIYEICKSESEYIPKAKSSLTWLDYLIHSIINNCKGDLGLLKNSNIKFITFNYDRMIERKMFETIRSMFNGIEVNKATEYVNEYASLNMHHVYGTLGEFDLANFGYIQESLYPEIVKKFRIIGERAEEDNSKILGLLDNADQLHFLGFAYNDENLKCLNLDKVSDIRLVSGTCVGLNRFERNSIQFKFWKNHLKRFSFNTAIPKNTNDPCLDYIKEIVELEEIGAVYHFRSDADGTIISITDLKSIFKVKDNRNRSSPQIDELNFSRNYYLTPDATDQNTYKYIGSFNPYSRSN